MPLPTWIFYLIIGYLQLCGFCCGSTHIHAHPSSYTLPLVYVTVVIVIIIKLHSSITIAYYDT